jgi:outer membrane protein assembly factor BamD (BamD/ComL family)
MALGEKRALKVFLCHASGDKPQVRTLYKHLVLEGVDAWLDQEKLLPGQNWKLEIPRAVQEADVVVVCLSNKSITKEGYIQKEIRFALDVADEKPEGAIFIIPARLEDCRVPEKLSRWQWVDLFNETGYVKLLSSLKLRAEIVGAVVSPSSYDDGDETERRLDQYYTEGLAAFYTEDWNKACQRFQLILSERPGDKNALEKFEEAERRRDLAKLYGQSAKAYQTGDWSTAIQSLGDLLKKSPDYKDAADLFKQAKRQKQLGDLYVEAKKLHAAKKWNAVLKVFEQMAVIDSSQPDPDGLLPSAQKEAAELKHLSDLNDLYSQSVREMDAGKWYEARKLLEQVHKTQTGFLETENLLTKIDDEISKIEKINERNNQINTLYEQAHGLIRSKNWRKVLEKVEEIRKLDERFEDKDGIAEKARLELDREEQEARRQDHLSAMYADSVRLLKDGKFQEALDKWNEVRVIDPKYPDRQQVQKTASKKLADINRRRKSRLGRLADKKVQIWGGSSLFLLVILAVAAFAIPIKSHVTTIEIPADMAGGVRYQIPFTGYYSFHYVDSAYSAYDLSGDLAGVNPWNTQTYCYQGKSPRWSNGSLDDTAVLFIFGSHDFINKEVAIASTRGAQEKIHLIKNEWITCVVGDSYYLDNSGEIILDVYYSVR